MDIQQFAIEPGHNVQLSKHDSAFTAHFKDEAAARDSITQITEDLIAAQNLLFAHESRALVVLFQGMDASGKDEAIQDVLSPLDPQGCRATKSEAPTKQELKHDYLRRFVKAMPESGQIGIFNRSYYEQLTGERVHPERLKQWNLQPRAQGEAVWAQRFEEVNNFEKYLCDNGIAVLKFFLHVSKETQRLRLLERACVREKQWEFSLSDMEDRRQWTKFMKVYADTMQHTSTPHAPWHIIPSDNRWFAHWAIASIITATLQSFHSQPPNMDKEQKSELDKARRDLEKEAPKAKSSAKK